MKACLKIKNILSVRWFFVVGILFFEYTLCAQDNSSYSFDVAMDSIEIFVDKSIAKKSDKELFRNNIDQFIDTIRLFDFSKLKFVGKDDVSVINFCERRKKYLQFIDDKYKNLSEFGGDLNDFRRLHDKLLLSKQELLQKNIILKIDHANREMLKLLRSLNNKKQLRDTLFLAFKFLLNDSDSISGNEIRLSILKRIDHSEKWFAGIQGIFSSSDINNGEVGLGAILAYSWKPTFESKTVWLVQSGMDFYFADKWRLGLELGITMFPQNRDFGVGISFSTYRTKIGGNLFIRF